jgi:flagellar biosynthesis component FlhA
MSAKSKIPVPSAAADMIPALGLTGVIIMMVLPMPPFFLDLALVLRI